MVRRVYLRAKMIRMTKRKLIIYQIPVEVAVKSNLTLPLETLGLSLGGFLQDFQSLFDVFLKLGVTIIDEVDNIVKCFKLETGENVYAELSSHRLP